MPPIDFTRRTALYRLYDDADVLLYVGIAFDPEARWKEHVRKPWWRDVARKAAEWHDPRLLALDAEAIAVEAERPLYNVLGADRPMPIPTGKPSRSQGQAVYRMDIETWEAFGRACAAKGISRSTAIRMHVKSQVAEWKRNQRREAQQAAAAAVASPDD